MINKFFLATVCLFVLLNMQAQVLHYDRPAEYFEEALPIGNGTIGGILWWHQVRPYFAQRHHFMDGRTLQHERLFARGAQDHPCH